MWAKESLLVSKSSRIGNFSVTTHPLPVSPIESHGTTVDSPAPRFLVRNDHPALWNRTTYIALLMLIALWAAKVYATWASWGNLTIDSGHEMYIPSLLAQGKVLYRDVWFLMAQQLLTSTVICFGSSV